MRCENYAIVYILELWESDEWIVEKFVIRFTHAEGEKKKIVNSGLMEYVYKMRVYKLNQLSFSTLNEKLALTKN